CVRPRARHLAAGAGLCLGRSDLDAHPWHGRAGLSVAAYLRHVLRRRATHLARRARGIPRPHVRGGERPAAVSDRRGAGAGTSARRHAGRGRAWGARTRPMIILCADDYALTEGVSRAVGELAAARRLSATSAMVTTPCWPAMAQRLVVHRGRIAVGLHLNLTLGGPLGAMPRLAPGGMFSKRNALLLRALLGLVGRAEVRGEIERQLDAFERHLGFPPDRIDGHEHVHMLPGIRQGLFDAVSRRYARAQP